MTLSVVPVVDTGVDDALALVVAARHPGLDLRAVGCTAGNAPLDLVVANTRYVLDLLGVQVPLLTGAERRLDGTPFGERSVHGPDGLAGLGPGGPAAADVARRLTRLSAEVVPEDAVVVSLGPLTSVRELAGRRVVASYSRPGQANHAMDPVAAAGASYEPIDVPAHAVPARSAMADTAAGSADAPVPRLVAGLLKHQSARGAGLGDAAVMLVLAEPTLAPSEWARRVVALANAEHWPR